MVGSKARRTPRASPVIRETPVPFLERTLRATHSLDQNRQLTPNFPVNLILLTSPDG
jgi:hypothetical protein